MIRRLYDSGYERDDVVAVLRFIDWVMRLPEELKVRLGDELQRLEREKKMEYVTSWERHGIKKGLLAGKSGVLKRLLGQRFGELPEWADRRLAEADVDELDHLSDRILDAERLVDVFGDAAVADS